MDFQEAMVEKLTQRRPAVQRVSNGIRQRCGSGFDILLVEPDFEIINEWFRHFLPDRNALVLRKSDYEAFDFEDALYDTEGIVGKLVFGLFGVFKVSLNVGPAVDRSGADALFFFVGEDTVENGSAISKQKAFVAAQDLGVIFALSIFCEVVEVVWTGFVAAVDRKFACYCFSCALADEGHVSFIGFDDARFKYELVDTVVEKLEFIGCLFMPAADGGAVNWNAEYFEFGGLPVVRQVAPELAVNYMGDESGTGVSFINRLKWFGFSEYAALAFFAAVAVFNMLDALRRTGNVFQLVRDFESARFSRDVAAGAEKLGGIGLFVLKWFFDYSGLRSVSAAATVRWRSRLSALFQLGVDSLAGVFVDILAFAFERVFVDLGGTWTVNSAIAPTRLLFELKNSIVHFMNQLVAFGDVIGELVRKRERSVVCG